MNGHIDIEVGGKTRRIRITRIHMEEDAGNSFTLVLQSKILVALMLTIIVLVYHLLKSYLNPDMHSPAEARAYYGKK